MLELGKDVYVSILTWEIIEQVHPALNSHCLYLDGYLHVGENLIPQNQEM